MQKYKNGWNVKHLATTYESDQLAAARYTMSHVAEAIKSSPYYHDHLVDDLTEEAERFEAVNPESTTAMFLKKNIRKLEEIADELAEAAEAFALARQLKLSLTELEGLGLFDPEDLKALVS